MKRLIIAAIAIAMLAAGTQLFALNKNQSLDYVRTVNRNATTEVDGTFYNPAGLVKLKRDGGNDNGFYFHVSNQTILQKKTIEDSDPTVKQFGQDPYEGTVAAYLFPDVHLAYKMSDKIVFFGNFMPIGGGGGGKYDDGLPMFEEIGFSTAKGIAAKVVEQYAALGIDTTNAKINITGYSSDMAFEGEEFALGFTLGSAYAINDMFSVAAAYRLTRYYLHYSGHAKNMAATVQITDMAAYNSEATDQANVAIGQAFAGQNEAAWKDVELDTEAVGYGHTFILGTNVALQVAGRDMNIGVSGEYQLETEREYKTDTLEGSDAVKEVLEESYKDGKKEKITEPIEFRFGVSYYVIPDKLMVEYDMTYNLKSQVDHDGAEDEYQNMMYTGAAVEYRVIDPLLVSLGYAYDSGDKTDKGRTELSYGGVAHHIGTGLEYTVMEDLDLSVGFLHSIYPEATKENSDGYDQKLGQTSETIGFGVTYAL